MSNIRYINQSAPFWDWIAQMENNGIQHPFAYAYNGQERGVGSDEEGGNTTDRRGGGWGGRGRGGWGARGRGGWGGHHHHHHHGPPPPPPAAPGEGEEGTAPDPPMDVPQPPQVDENGNPMPTPAGPPPFARGPWARRGRHCGPGRGRAGFMGMPFDLSGLGEMFGFQAPGNDNKGENGDYVPPVDVFDTENAFVVHISLPGAKKEDVAVNWDAEKSELVITGVIYRPGDEDFLKTLALDERNVGAFERKVRLGSRIQPARVDDDAITAKLEDGVLRVEVPKEDRDFVEVKKVDVY